jgi:uncharacterized membrane protein
MRIEPFIIIAWALSGILLVYDGLFDACNASSHSPVIDLLEMLIGVGLLGFAFYLARIVRV